MDKSALLTAFAGLTADERRALVRAAEHGDTDATAQGAGAEPVAVTPAHETLKLPAPLRAIWADAAPPDDAVLCAIGEPLILAAPGGSGKSYVALSLALAAVAGEQPARACGLRVRPGGVLLVNYEDAAARIGARLNALLGREDATPDPDLSRLALVADPLPLWTPAIDRADGAVATAAFEGLRARALDDLPSVIVIDPISAAVGGADLNSAAVARTCVTDLARLSTDTGAGVLAIAHDTKAARNETRAGGSPGAGAVAGSGQWYDAARGVLYLATGPDGSRVLTCEKANHGRAGWGRQLVGVQTGSVFRGFRAAGVVIHACGVAQTERAESER